MGSIINDEDEEDEDDNRGAILPGHSHHQQGSDDDMMVPNMQTSLEEEEGEDDDDEEEEEEDEIVYTATDLGYEWQGEPDLAYEEEEVGYEDLGYEDQSQFTNSSTNENSSDINMVSSGATRRVSSLRASRAGNSYSSAPENGSDNLTLIGEERAQRRSTFAGPPEHPGRDGLSRRVSSRRAHINLGSVAAPSGMNPLTMSSMLEEEDTGAAGHAPESVLQKMKSISFGSHARRSTAMKARRAGSTMSSGSDLNSMQAAASKLESGTDSVFAAASVVAQSAATAAKRGHVQFNTEDAVLCMLTLLNVTNPGDDTESFTVSPVNIHGYPPGEGKTELERQGPYVFVLATVKKVHFDEDERYYTVVRADNGTEQRADTGKSFDTGS